MPIPTKMADLSTLAASNSPAGSDPVGNSLDDYLRGHAAILRSTNAEASATIVSASTTDIGAADAEAVTVSGNATITSLGVAPPGIRREVKFTGTPTLTHGSSIVLNGANIAVQASDVHTFRSEGGGIWRLVASKRPIITSAMVTGALGFTPLNAAAVSAFGLTLIDDADAAAARTTLGLGTMATQAATSYAALSGATFTGDVTMQKIVPTLLMRSPSGANRWNVLASVSDTDNFGLYFQRWNGSAFVDRLVVLDTGISVTGAGTFTGGVSGTTGAFSGAVSDVIGNVRDIPVTVRNSSTAFAATDRGRAVVKDNTTAYSWTVNTGIFTAGMAIPVINDGSAGNVTIVQGAGMTVIAGTTTGDFVLAPGESRTLIALSATRVRVL